MDARDESVEEAKGAGCAFLLLLPVVGVMFFFVMVTNPGIGRAVSCVMLGNFVGQATITRWLRPDQETPELRRGLEDARMRYRTQCW